MNEEIEKNKNDIINYENQQTEFAELQKKLNELKDFKEEKIRMEKLKESIETKLHEKELIDTEIKNYNNLIAQTEKQFTTQLKSIKHQVEDKEDRFSQLDVDMTKEEAFNILKEDGILTERLSRLQNVEIPMAKEYNDSTRLNEFTSLVKKTQKEVSLLQPKQKQISKDIFIADELKSDQNVLKDQIMDIEKKKQEEFEEFYEEIRKLEKLTQEKSLNEDFNEKLQLAKSELSIIQEEEQEKESLEAQLRKLKDYSLLIEKVEKDITQLNKNLKTLDDKLMKLESSYKKYLDIVEVFGRQQQELQDFESTIKGLQVEIGYITKDINAIMKTKDEVKKIKKELKDIKNNVEIYTLLRKDIFHLNGVPRFAIEKILPEISIRASEILSDLTDGKFNLISFKPLGGTRVGFEIYVFDGERDREASSFSGGEKTQINAAIRFAIMEKISEIPDTTGALFRKSNTLLIDEGDLGTLDDETARQRFVDKIFELKSMFKKIILITHLEDVAEQFPNRIVIGWNELGNSKIYH